VRVNWGCSVGEWEPYGLSSRVVANLWRHPTGYVRASLGRSFTSNPSLLLLLLLLQVPALEEQSALLLIAGGLYSVPVTALLKTGAKVTVYARHLELKQACIHASATTKTRVSSRCAWRRRPVPRPLSLPRPWPRLLPPAPVPSPRRHHRQVPHPLSHPPPL
jgi:hypothetical protein